jgi:hypothetical protein
VWVDVEVGWLVLLGYLWIYVGELNLPLPVTLSVSMVLHTQLGEGVLTFRFHDYPLWNTAIHTVPGINGL